MKRGTENRAPFFIARDTNRQRLAATEIFDVAIGAKANVVGEIPAIVVGIVVDHDLVAVPIPIVAVGIVIGCDAEIEAAEPEAFAIAAGDAPDVAAANAPGEAAMLPDTIEMIVGIIAAGIVADPLVIVVNVRSVGMIPFIGISWGLLHVVAIVLPRVILLPGGRRAMRRNVASTDILGLFARMLLPAMISVLRESRNRAEQEQSKNCEK